MLSGLVERTLVNCRILVVEDRYLVADDLGRICRRQGGEIVGLASDVEKARRLAAEERVDLAILDVDLRGQDVFDVAAILDGRGVPFVFVTGYGQVSLPERYRSRPIVTKPFSEGEVLAALMSLLSGRRGDGEPDR